MEKYLKTFHRMRFPNALSIYAKNIRTESTPELQSTFQRFVRSVLEDSFYNERYRTDINPHLKHLEEHAPQILEAWRQPASLLPISTVLPSFSSVQEQSFPKWLHTQWQQGHFKLPDTSSPFPFLARFLHFPEERSKVEQELKEAIRVKKNEKETKNLAIQQMCILLCSTDSDSSSKTTQQARLQSLAEKLRLAYPELIVSQEIQDFISSPGNNNKKNSLSIVDTDNWEDLFLCGTEGAASCQAINARASLNRALLAYIMDGKNRLIAVKNTKGQIVARCMFRLLWSTASAKPVVFQEKIYPIPCNAEIEKALNLYAIQRAKELGCELFTVNKRSDLEAVSAEIISMGSSAPFEYVDADGGGVTDGNFSISRAQKVLGT